MSSQDNKLVNTDWQKGESVVLHNEESHKLRYCSIVRCVSVRSCTLSADDGNVEYVEGKDFVMDYAKGTITRTKGSRIPDWAEHVLFGVSNFNHNLYKDCSNRSYTIYMDYEYDKGANPPSETSSRIRQRTLQRTISKLAKQESVRYIVFGDSISAGGDASREEFAFYHRFADELRTTFNTSLLQVVNKAIGGEGSTTGLQRLEQDVIALKPDLVSIGYGMNDQCTMSEEIRNGIPPGLFESNIRQMVKDIQEKTDAEIILVTPCLSNPLWIHSSGDLAIYSDILVRLGDEFAVCVADVYSLWVQELKAGKTHESLLLNNINHPNDYGHWIYYQAFLGLIRDSVR